MSLAMKQPNIFRLSSLHHKTGSNKLLSYREKRQKPNFSAAPLKNRIKAIKESEKIIGQIMRSKIPEQEIISQFITFKNGISPVKLERPCTIDDGIVSIPPENENHLIELSNKAALQNRFMKFIPASGAATRMFKPFFSLINDGEGKKQDNLYPPDVNDQPFFTIIKNLAFYPKLTQVLKKKGVDIKTLKTRADMAVVIQAILEDDGLGYGNCPKGLIRFHRYNQTSATAFEEHIHESIDHMLGRNNTLKLHFTVPVTYYDRIKKHISNISTGFKKKGILLSVTLSLQDPSTDTIAVSPENILLSAADDRLAVRPAGHGALLRNLNKCHGDIVFIKNIDNVLHSTARGDSLIYKKILGGFFVQLQDQIFKLLYRLEDPADIRKGTLEQAETMVENKLNRILPEGYNLFDKQQKAQYLYSQLNRPLRVCGMIKNQGDPGGGPFWVKNQNLVSSLQIVEGAQIDTADPDQFRILKESTHFNPVDIVCGLRDHNGEQFNLPDFVDNTTGFITDKTQKGVDLKALELPGLWNGGMALWNTVFIQVPPSTFSPVKSVFDLLNPTHQPLPPLKNNSSV